ncbi:MAG: tRNA lysidine(34) synthetase TilS [Clostridia bacterium]
MLEQKVLDTISKYNLIKKGDKIVIGVSGGPDSMCLLDSLYYLKNNLQIEIIVAHINHMIRKEADEETEYVQNYCNEKNIKCYVKKVDVTNLAKEKKLGTEEMGRKIRYEFFQEIYQKENANKIATAHNLNDNAETVLLNILRGSGISGLKGIEAKRCEFIRPLIECTRGEIEEYCEKQKLNPKIDKTNFENIYNRNKIRNSLIPYLQKEFNPNILETLNRLSDIAKEEEEYFEQVISKKYEELKIGENEKEIILDLNKFNKLQKVIKSRLILYTINKVNGTIQGIGKIHIEDIIKLCQNNIGNKYIMPNKNIKVFVKKGKIFFMGNINLP